MQIIPAIDLRGGCCVRLRQGDYEQETVFGSDPVVIARRWEDEGAEFLHLVDLDGAREGRPVNTQVIAKIVEAVSIPCQLGGGLRSETSIQMALDLGLQRTILGTRAVDEPDWLEEMTEKFPDRLVLGLDAKEGRVAREGWLEVSDLSALALAQKYDSLPLVAIVYTDISRDGMLGGPNFAATHALAKASRHPVIASGGITTIEDVLELRRLRIGACILGRSLYEGTILLPALLARLGQKESPEEVEG